MNFEPSREAALSHLKRFIPNAGRNYASRRNHDLGPGKHSNVSMLSPYIRHRLITEEEVLEQVLAHHTPSAAEKFIQEVYWRTYFKGWLETRPIVWARYHAELERQKHALEIGSGFRKQYEAAVEGRTGVDAFDAFVRELTETGYLHNHARMWFASIWIFTLRLPWQLGADFMYYHLIDGDPASNTLSWRWVGGLHTKGKTYLARASNIREYTNERFDPKGLAHDAPPLEEEDLPCASTVPPAAAEPREPFLLLVTEEDLHPQSLFEADVAGVVSLATPDNRAANVIKFKSQALQSASQVAAEHFKVTHTHAETMEDVFSHAQSLGVKVIATAYAPVGKTADVISGLALQQVRREFDTKAWPHCTKGFFALKEKIPTLLHNHHKQGSLF